MLACQSIGTAGHAGARRGRTRRRDGMLCAAFGKVPGGEYVDYQAAVKRAGFAEYHAEISPREIRRYLTL